jgi:hypothetical protein
MIEIYHKYNLGVEEAKTMLGSSFTRRQITTEGCERNYAIAEQWLATYLISSNPRHLDTAHTCYAIANELYSQSFDQYLDRDDAPMRRSCSQSRKRVSETFATCAAASRVLDGSDPAAAPVEEPCNPNR